MRDKLAERIKRAFLAFVHAIGIVWTFMCVKTQDPDESDVRSDEIRQDVINFLCFIRLYKFNTVKGRNK